MIKLPNASHQKLNKSILIDDEIFSSRNLCPFKVQLKLAPQQCLLNETIQSKSPSVQLGARLIENVRYHKHFACHLIVYLTKKGLSMSN